MNLTHPNTRKRIEWLESHALWGWPADAPRAARMAYGLRACFSQMLDIEWIWADANGVVHDDGALNTQLMLTAEPWFLIYDHPNASREGAKRIMKCCDCDLDVIAPDLLSLLLRLADAVEARYDDEGRPRDGPGA